MRILNTIMMAVVIMMAFEKQEVKTIPAPVIHPKPRVKGGTEDFMNAIARMESDQDQFAVNEYGMLGKYQFSPRTLRVMGVNTTKEEFLANEALQDSVMKVYMKNNYYEVYPKIKRFIGTYVNGILITKSGIIAGAHLTGTQGILAYFFPDQYHAILRDANGATIEMYMRRFGNYNISFE